jgi:hypothetical protein
MYHPALTSDSIDIAAAPARTATQHVRLAVTAVFGDELGSADSTCLQVVIL